MIKLATNTINSEDFKALSTWLKTEPHLTQGKLVEEFEAKFAGYMGVNYSVFLNSGSSANLLIIASLMAMGKIKKGDKVVVPGVCWATDLAPVMQLGLEPELCDINLRNLSVDIVCLEDLFQKRKPKALMLVSVLGMPPDIEEIVFLCKKYDVILIEDNCESLGSRYDGHLLGTYGYASSTSLYFGHHISTIEGGMVFTNDKEFYDVLKMVRAHGWDRNLDIESKASYKKKYGIDNFNARYTFYYPGFNLRSTDLNAFIGLRQLIRLPDIVRKREENFAFYQKNIKNIVWKPEIPKENFVSNLGYPLISSRRDKIVKFLDKSGIECRPLISGAIGRQPFFTDIYGVKPLVNSDKVHNHGLYLPNHADLTDVDLDNVCRIVNNCI